jgi:hypothetical protein
VPFLQQEQKTAENQMDSQANRLASRDGVIYISP